MVEGRACTKCSDFKAWSEFNNRYDGRGKNGKYAECKECQVRRHVDNPENKATGKGQAKGEKQHMAKLTEEKVLEIRRLYNTVKNYSELARRYSVSNFAIKCVVTRKTWKHI